uniref:Uncharacterized protein n=1 Tax=Caenorhabditis japonica TaxID=281687 RepID=A0A8R1IBS1_CAEJA
MHLEMSDLSLTEVWADSHEDLMSEVITAFSKLEISDEKASEIAFAQTNEDSNEQQDLSFTQVWSDSHDNTDSEEDKENQPPSHY